IVRACGSLRDLARGRQIHADILASDQLSTDRFLANALLEMYGKCGSVGEAQRTFTAMPERDVFSWNAALGGFGQHGQIEAAMEVKNRMPQWDVGAMPDGITFLALLVGYCHAGMWSDTWHAFHWMVGSFGLVPELCHYNAVVEMLARSKRLKRAEELLHSMPFLPDVASW
ncbi:hypothetical protein SELMODRAFT_71753, partial [Selaginella moellendorffii]